MSNVKRKIFLFAVLAALFVTAFDLSAEERCVGDPFACTVNSIMGSIGDFKAVVTPAPSAYVRLKTDAVKIPARRGPSVLELDPERAGRLALAAVTGNLGHFDGKAYEYVFFYMEKAGIIRPEQREQLKIGRQRAADFAEWAVLNKELMLSELKLYRIPTPEDKMAVPAGSIIVYERGVCGSSLESGHIEVVTQINWACSDGCENLRQTCFEDPAARKGIYVIVPVK